MTPLNLSTLTADEKALLDVMVERGEALFEPNIGPEGVTYPEMEGYSQEVGWDKVLRLLSSLTEKGFLASEDVEHAIFCPSCESPHVYSKYTCPRCNSSHVNHVTLMQHPHCGYHGEKGTFIKGKRLICPKCNTDLGPRNGRPPGDGSKQDYRVLGSTFDCEKCDYRFDKPNIVHFCPHCGAPFDYRTAIIRKLYSFKLSPETIELQRHEPEVAKVLKAVAAVMHGRGFGVEQDVDVRGLSGSDHSFSLVATKGTVRTVVDVSTFGSQNDLVSLLGKKMDLIGSDALLVDMTGNEELSSLGKVYNIQILPPGGMALGDILGAYIDGVEQRESESPRVVVNE